MKKNLLVILFGAILAIGLAACGGNDNANDSNGGGEAVASSPEEIYQNSTCINCHGENLEGRNGPKLSDIGSVLSRDQILDAIVEGRPGMPGNLLKGDDAERVADWLAEQK